MYDKTVQENKNYNSKKYLKQNDTDASYTTAPLPIPSSTGQPYSNCLSYHPHQYPVVVTLTLLTRSADCRMGRVSGQLRQYRENMTLTLIVKVEEENYLEHIKSAKRKHVEKLK